MTTPDETTPDGTTPDGTTPPTDIAAVRADIEQARAELAETVDALSDKLDVKARAGDKVAEARGKVADTARSAKESTPPQVQHAIDRIGEKAAPLAHRVNEATRPHRAKIVAGAVAAVAVVTVVRKRAER